MNFLPKLMAYFLQWTFALLNSMSHLYILDTLSDTWFAYFAPGFHFHFPSVCQTANILFLCTSEYYVLILSFVFFVS
jgi:hypothetical protein